MTDRASDDPWNSWLLQDGVLGVTGYHYCEETIFGKSEEALQGRDAHAAAPSPVIPSPSTSRHSSPLGLRSRSAAGSRGSRTLS